MLNMTQLLSRISLTYLLETFLHVFQGPEVTSSQLKNWYALLRNLSYTSLFKVLLLFLIVLHASL
jgi:hypothetical protein